MRCAADPSDGLRFCSRVMTAATGSEADSAVELAGTLRRFSIYLFPDDLRFTLTRRAARVFCGVVAIYGGSSGTL